jgi:hypothetical protein
MYYDIKFEHGVLKATLFGRETGEETQEFIAAIAAQALALRATRVLVWVRASRPIFRVERYGLSEHFKRAAANPAGYRIALLADTDELRSSHEYIETLARQQGVAVRSFRAEAAALDWLHAAAPALAPAPEKLQSQEKR